jgi:adenylylsulfate kinase-like enzyme
LISHFTGITDPYEAPRNAEVVIDTAQKSAEEAADAILDYLSGRGRLRI